jgi:hypothetical protein
MKSRLWNVWFRGKRSMILQQVFMGTLRKHRSGALLILGMLIGSAAHAVVSEQPALEVDQSFMKALKADDQTAVGAFLDKDFTWTDLNGRTRDRSETLRDLVIFARDKAGFTTVNSYRYQKLAITFGSKEDARFVRIWVKRPLGWFIFAELDTPTVSVNTIANKFASSPAAPAANESSDCDNPCRTLPYESQSKAQEAVLKEWQETKVDEWHPNPSDWSKHAAQEFHLINDHEALNKEQRVKIAYDNEKKGIGMPGDPIASMSMYEFGDAMVMISHHSPHRGKGPYYNLRVFIHRDGHWPIVWSQQTTIKAPQG